MGWAADAVEAVDVLLSKVYGLDVSKATLDPTNTRDFTLIVTRLSRAISRATEKTEREILNKAIRNLDVDWTNLTERQRNAVFRAVSTAITSIPRRILPQVEQRITLTGPDVVRGTRRGVRESLSATLRSRIGTSLTEQDTRIVTHLSSSQSLYVTDEYRRRRDVFSADARRIVAEGLENGLGRDEITNDLVSRFDRAAGINKSRAYWNVISSAYVGRARTWGHLTSFREAAIERYVFEAVLDERTTDQCAALHGRTFETEHAAKLMEAAEASEDPEAVKDITPWLRVGRDDEGNRILYTQDRAGNRTHVADVVRSRVGVRDGLGTFRNMRSTSELSEMGLVMPPLHGNCRSTIVADV